jgi:DnaJ-class molecular chaperone
MILNRQLFSVSTPDTNIEAIANMTLQHSFEGVSVTEHVTRTILNKACESVVCPVCKGTGVQLNLFENHAHSVKKTLSSPCPECFGLGYCGLNQCSLYHTYHDTIQIVLPVGFLPGHKYAVSKKGNEVLSADHKVITGDFIFTVDQIFTGNYTLTKSGDVELKVLVTPVEAFEGFLLEDNYPSGENRIIRVDRTNKITVPGSTCRIKHVGIPLVSNITEHLPDSNSTRGDLLIRFELTDFKKEENIVLTSTEDLKLHLASVRRDLVLRKFLNLLSSKNGDTEESFEFEQNKD